MEEEKVKAEIEGARNTGEGLTAEERWRRATTGVITSEEMPSTSRQNLPQQHFMPHSARYSQTPTQPQLMNYGEIPLQGMTIVGDMPKFKGRARPGETNFKEGVNVRTFFRSLENMFLTRNIVDDDTKVRICFQFIDKERGDACLVMDGFAGRRTQFKIIKECFLRQYPVFTKTEFPLAATAVLGSDILKPSIYCGINALEKTTRAFSEAYLNSPGMKESGVTMETKMKVRRKDEEGVEREVDVYAEELIQNCMMHTMLATQLPTETYKKFLEKKKLKLESMELASEAISVTERELSMKAMKQKNKIKQGDEVLYEIKSEIKCFNCKLKGHIAKDCKSKPICRRCREPGHIAKECKQGEKSQTKKYCYFCKKPGHLESNCYRKAKARPGRGRVAENVRETKGVCSHCKKKGHDSGRCYLRNKKATSNGQTKKVRTLDEEESSHTSGEETEEEEDF